VICMMFRMILLLRASSLVVATLVVVCILHTCVVIAPTRCVEPVRQQHVMYSTRMYVMYVLASSMYYVYYYVRHVRSMDIMQITRVRLVRIIRGIHHDVRVYVLASKTYEREVSCAYLVIFY